MKRIKYILILLLAGFVSCNDLELIPESALTGSNFPLTENDAIAAINGVYVPNSDFSSSSSYYADLPTDATQCGENVTSGSGASIGTFEHDPQNGYMLTAWSTLFKGVTAASSAIDRFSEADIDSKLKARLTGEAKFLRALYYFYLVQLFGDVPIILHESDGDGATRAPIDDVYTQIVQDLTDASAPDVLPTSYSETTDKGRATNGAAYALLAKANLVWAQTSPDRTKAKADERFAAAVTAAEKVSGYELEGEFLNNWNTSQRNGKENIFSAHHIASQYPATGNGYNHLAHCSFATGFEQDTPHLVISNLSFYEKFDDRDQRKKGSYAKTLYNPETGKDFVFIYPRFRKYIDTANILTTNLTLSIDRTILRYADVLLIKAEAENELNGPTTKAYDAINQIRRRAFRQPLATTSNYDLPAGLSKEQFRDTLREERFKEFVYEQQRWFDLVRWRILVKTVKPVKNQNAVPRKDDDGEFILDDNKNKIYDLKETSEKAAIQLKHYRFPIPQTQRNINPDGLWQNWGWDGADDAKTGANPYAGFE